MLFTFLFSVTLLLSAKPQLELNLLSFLSPCAFTAAPGTRRVQAPFARPVALVLLILLHFFLRICSERHCAKQIARVPTSAKFTEAHVHFVS